MDCPLRPVPAGRGRTGCVPDAHPDEEKSAGRHPWCLVPGSRYHGARTDHLCRNRFLGHSPLARAPTHTTASPLRRGDGVGTRRGQAGAAGGRNGEFHARIRVMSAAGRRHRSTAERHLSRGPTGFRSLGRPPAIVIAASAEAGCPVSADMLSVSNLTIGDDRRFISAPARSTRAAPQILLHRSTFARRC